jgi:hypothetical protein
MPPLRRVWRVARLVTLPETRRLIVATARPSKVRAIAHRVATDRAGVVRDLANRRNARRFISQAAHHPAAAELANAGVLLLPMRYTPVGWVATWVARRVLRRPAGEVEASKVEAPKRNP